MRVTNRMISEKVLRDIMQTAQQMQKIREELSSGKKVREPSDSPEDIARILSLRSELAEFNQYKKNITESKNWLDTTSSTLTQIEDALMEVLNIGHQAKSGLIGSEERQALADQVDEYLKELINLANTRSNGKAIFGGTQTLTDPFIPQYTNGKIISVIPNPNGIDGTIRRRISRTQTIIVNSKGSDLFQPNGAGVDDDLFQVVIDLRDSIGSGDVNSISTALSRLENVIDRVVNENAVVGTKINILEFTQKHLEAEVINNKEVLSSLEDADLIQAIIDYQNKQNIYQAAILVGARLLQLSLINFL